MEAKNKEQQEAVDIGIEFLNNGNSDEWLIIGGKAGTGKTSIAEIILQDFIKKKKVLVIALSHKAKLIISEKLAKAYGHKSFISTSVAGALGMNMDPETGKFVIDRNAIRIPPIKQAHIIICDEASMINEQSHELIMREKRKTAKVIFLGDIRQLPPIREAEDPNCEKPSPVFYSTNLAVLKERIRQGENSPILPYADYFGDNTRIKHPFLNPVPSDARVDTVTDNGALVFADNPYEVIETFLPLYKYAVEKSNMDVIKMVTYRNETRRSMNELIREYIFGKEAASDQFTMGDLLMFQDNFSIPDFDEPVSNSFEIQINRASSLEEQFKVWVIDFIFESKPVSIKVLDKTEVKRHGAEVSRLFEYAKKLPNKTQARTDALSKAWSLKNRYAPIDYAYAITSHKSQGSTYNTVIVDERDIMTVSMTTNKSKSQSMYTAITRSSTTCVIIDGKHQCEESLARALKLSTEKLNITLP